MADKNILTVPEAGIQPGSFLFAEVNEELVKVPVDSLPSGGEGGGGPIPDRYVFVDSESGDDENDIPEEGLEPTLNADLFGGYKPEHFATKADLENVGDIFSNDEVRIGYWIDGKPLYRKMLRHTATGVENNIPSGIDDREHLHIDFGNSYWTGPDGTVAYSFIYASFIKDCAVSMNSGTIFITGARDLSGYIFNFAMMYTKSSDSPV